MDKRRKARPEEVDAAVLKALTSLNTNGDKAWGVGAFAQHVLATAPELGLSVIYIQKTYLAGGGRIAKKVRAAIHKYNQGLDVGPSTETRLSDQKKEYEDAISSISHRGMCTVQKLAKALEIKEFMVRSFLHQNPEFADKVADYQKGPSG